MGKTIEVGQDMILIMEVVMDITQEVVKDMGDKIITTEGGTLEIKIMIETGVGHMRDRVEIKGMVEALVIVDQGQVQGQLQIDIRLDAIE